MSNKSDQYDHTVEFLKELGFVMLDSSSRSMWDIRGGTELNKGIAGVYRNMFALKRKRDKWHVVITTKTELGVGAKMYHGDCDSLLDALRLVIGVFKQDRVI